MKIAIFASTILDGNLFLKHLVEDMKYGDVEKFIETPRYIVILNDGTEYLVLPSNDSMRGYKFQKAYVSNKVSNEFVRTRVQTSFWPDSVDIQYFNE